MVLCEVFNQSCVTFVSESGSHQKERPSKECSICYGDDIALHPLTCCPGDICAACFKKLRIQRCPFCNTPFTGMKGDQPDGKMDVRFEDHMRLKGHERHGTFTITYKFSSGRQGVSIIYLWKLNECKR